MDDKEIIEIIDIDKDWVNVVIKLEAELEKCHTAMGYYREDIQELIRRWEKLRSLLDNAEIRGLWKGKGIEHFRRLMQELSVSASAETREIIPESGGESFDGAENRIGGRKNKHSTCGNDHQKEPKSERGMKG